MSDDIPDGAFITESALIDMAARMDPSLKARVIDGSLIVDIATDLNAKIQKQYVPISFTWEQLVSASPWEQDRKPGHTETTPKSEAWLAERELFATGWEQHRAYGIKNGFLEQDSCHECGGGDVVTTNTEDREWVWDE